MDTFVVVVIAGAAQTSPGGRDRLHSVHPVVCMVDCGRRRFDWFAGRTPSHEERNRPVIRVVEDLVEAAIKETNWWRNAANDASEIASKCSWSGTIADFSDPIDWDEQQSASKVLRGFTVLDTAALMSRELDSNLAEATIASLQASPCSTRLLQRRAPGSVYKLCMLVVHEVLLKHALVLKQPERFDGTFQSFVHDASAVHCMRMNPAARSALAAPASSTPHQSILGVILRACSTKRGRKCLQKWIDRPSVDAKMLRARHDTVQTFVQLLKDTQEASTQDTSPLDRIARFFRHFQAFESKLETFSKMREESDTPAYSTRPSLSSFVDLARWIRAANDIVERQASIGENAVDPDVGDYCLAVLHRHVGSLLPLCTLVRQVVDPAPISSEVVYDEAMARGVPVAASTLRELRSQIQQCKGKISAAVSQAAEALHLQKSRIRVLYDEDDQPGFPTSGVVLRISRQDGHRVHRHNGKLVTIFKASRSAGVWFTVPSIDDLGTRWKVLKDRYDATELEVVRLVVSTFREQYQSVLVSVMREAGELDVMMAFALVSKQHGFARADLSENVEGDPAMIEIVAPFSPFIPGIRNTQEWSLRLDQSHRFLLLEGEEVADDAPLLHVVGTIAVLNQIGCFVPCASARLPLFDAILLRGGAYDQQLYGFSMFMTEMKEVTLILENMTSKSLVLIDDLCRGTASNEGLGLAMSICSHLIAHGASVCFSSQWRELTSQVEALEGVTVPKPHGSVPSPERRRTEEDRRFGQLLIDAEMPRELIGLIQQELDR